MSRYWTIGVALVACVAAGALDTVPSRRSRTDRAAADVRSFLSENIDSLDASLDSLTAAVGRARDAGGVARARAAFRGARLRYKRVEGVVELYAPALAAAFNSRRQEVDDDDAPPPSMLGASGFPALERVMWPRFDSANADSARRLSLNMGPLVSRIRSLVPALVPTDAQLIEIARQELARVATLGIAGFDAPSTGEAIRESAAAVDGIRELLRVGRRTLWRTQSRELEEAERALARAATYLNANPDFENFNRLAFIAAFEEPAARAIDELRRAGGTRPVLFQRAWRADVPSVFAAGAFDPKVYAPTTAPSPTPELIALGERLFNDPRLSGPGTRSCASCHHPAHAFTDGVPRAPAIDGKGFVARNTPTLINAGLQPAQFADERSASLEDQVLEVLRSQTEMASSAEIAAARLGGSATPLGVRQALAAYVRSLIALDSRFDRAVRGDTAALSAEERRGFTLFMGKGACGSCHFAPLFSGDTPPRYLNSDVEVVGTPASSASPTRLDADSGRARIDHLPIHLRAFKTPSLRNVALTAPYMHNGAFRTLDEVMEFYNAGGGAGAGAHIPNQTLSADSLHLTAAERRAIVAFLGALTDTALSSRSHTPRSK